MGKVHDVVVVGGGLAGLSAAWVLNLLRADFLLVAEEVGGKILESPRVMLYPFVNMSGREMVEWLLRRVPEERMVQDRIVRAELGRSVRVLHGASGREYRCRAVIFATGGVSRNVLRGVELRTCPLCELPSLRGKTVLLIYDQSHYLSTARGLRGVAARIDAAWSGDIARIERRDGRYVVEISGETREYDEVFYLAEPEPRVDIEGVPDTKPDARLRIAPLVYVAGDVHPLKPLAVYAVASGIEAALEAVEELDLYAALTMMYGGTARPELELPELRSSEELEKVVGSHREVLVVWHSLYCGPCYIYEGVLRRVRQREELPIYLASADAIDPRPYRVKVLPTTVFYRNGREVWRREGVVRAEELVRLLRNTTTTTTASST